MAHPLVSQLWFNRNELVHCLEKVSPEDALRRIKRFNCLNCIVGHLASQEYYLWVESAQNIDIASNLHELVI